MYDFIFICGPYKTGTSLITNLAEVAGYNNPAKTNNSNEIGKGLTRNYFTNECIITREINNDILTSSNLLSFNKIFKIAIDRNHCDTNISNIIQFISSFDVPTVLKDGQLAYTLHLWIYACKLLRKNVAVCFTNRDTKELLRAWNKAYYTKYLLGQNNEAIYNMLIMCELQRKLCCESNIFLQNVNFNIIKYD